MNPEPFNVQVTFTKKYIEDRNHVVETKESSKDLLEEIFRLKEELKSEREEVKNVKIMNQNLTSELNKVGDELYETKIELTRQQSLAKYMTYDLNKSKDVIKNQKCESSNLKQISEAKFQETKDVLNHKDEKIQTLNAELEILVVKTLRNTTYTSRCNPWTYLYKLVGVGLSIYCYLSHDCTTTN